MLARARQQKPQVGRGRTGLGSGEAAAANDSEVIPLLRLGPGQDYRARWSIGGQACWASRPAQALFGVQSLASLRWRLCQCRLLGFTHIQGARVAAAAAGLDHLPRPGSLSRGHLPSQRSRPGRLHSPPRRVHRGQARRPIRSETASHQGTGSDSPGHWPSFSCLSRVTVRRPGSGNGQGGQARVHLAQLWLAGAVSRALPVPGFTHWQLDWPNRCAAQSIVGRAAARARRDVEDRPN